MKTREELDTFMWTKLGKESCLEKDCNFWDKNIVIGFMIIDEPLC